MRFAGCCNISCKRIDAVEHSDDLGASRKGRNLPTSEKQSTLEKIASPLRRGSKKIPQSNAPGPKDLDALACRLAERVVPGAAGLRPRRRQEGPGEAVGRGAGRRRREAAAAGRLPRRGRRGQESVREGPRGEGPPRRGFLTPTPVRKERSFVTQTPPPSPAGTAPPRPSSRLASRGRAARRSRPRGRR